MTFDICIGRFNSDPEAQGVVRAEDGAWQLVIDKDGFPHLYVRVRLEQQSPDDPSTGLLCLDDMLPSDMSVRDLMTSLFGGKLSPADEAAARAEFLERKAAHSIPCPR